MLRLGLLVPLLTASILQATAPPTPCKAREIAFVTSFIGTWNDGAYSRKLTPNLPVCSDSELLRIKDGKQSEKDQLVLRDLFGGSPITFNCSDLLNCAKAIQLEEIKKKLEEKLKGKTPGQSFEEFQRNHNSQTSTISSTIIVMPTDWGARHAFFEGVVVNADEPLQASAITGALAFDYNDVNSFGICLNAEKQYCFQPQQAKLETGATILPVGNMPAGLHVLYEFKTPDANMGPPNFENSTFVLAVPSWGFGGDLEPIRTKLALAWINPNTTSDQLSSYVLHLASEATKQYQ